MCFDRFVVFSQKLSSSIAILVSDNRLFFRLLLIISFLSSFIFNYEFLSHGSLTEMVKLNDVSSIFAGYHKVPSFGAALLAYWHAPWIQQDIFCFRPISGIQYWTETYIGLHFGFIWNAWIGFALFSIAVWLIGMLSFRLFDSKLLAIFSALMASGVRFYNPTHPDYWLIWYPIHQDILMLDFLFGALLVFDIWLEKRTKLCLIATWCLFLLGCLTKEFNYAFPFMAFVLVRTRRRPIDIKGLYSYLQPFLFAAAVGGLLLVRKHLYAHPRNVHFNMAVICHKPLMFMYGSLGLNIVSRNYTIVTFAALLAAACFAILRRRGRDRKRSDKDATGFSIYRIVKSLAEIVLFMGVASFALWLEGENIFVFLMQTIDGSITGEAMLRCTAMSFTLILTVFWWRSSEPIALAWFFLFLCYLPVLSFIGWHYTFPAGMMRGIYWAAMIRLAALELNQDGFIWSRKTFAPLGIPCKEKT